MSKFSHMSHGAGEHATGHAGKTIARDGSPKKVTPVMHHPAMTRQQTDAAGCGGMSHAVAQDTPGAAPLAHAYGSAADLKTGKAVAPVPGQRSRTNADTETHADKCQHGADMLAQSVKC